MADAQRPTPDLGYEETVASEALDRFIQEYWRRTRSLDNLLACRSPDAIGIRQVDQNSERAVGCTRQPHLLCSIPDFRGSTPVRAAKTLLSDLGPTAASYDDSTSSEAARPKQVVTVTHIEPAACRHYDNSRLCGILGRVSPISNVLWA
jgi:hypothetical protein